MKTRKLAIYWGFMNYGWYKLQIPKQGQEFILFFGKASFSNFVEIKSVMESYIFFQIGDLDKELEFSFSRSSGPGGQNVNKVNSKVELRFSVVNSILLSSVQKEIISAKLANQLLADGSLLVVSQTSRSQLENKELAIVKFYSMINKALKPTKRRIKTKVSASANEKRIQGKKQLSEKKSRRRLNLN
mgnify:CR=1 FL=1